ncbi:MAG: protein kinase [Deltaproteobacteria bacterium]|nr:protein kinase [Deltaproteobacteria bacterium]
MSALQPERFGKYLLLDRIATGGMAELYRGKITGDEGFEKLVAVKKILPHLVGEKGLIESFINEARLAAFLQHENIIRTHDFGKMGKDYFIAMEYLFGRNLRSIIGTLKKKNRLLDLEIVLQIISCVCNGLDYAHTLKNFQGQPLNIIHRDISPPNIFISYKGEVKIIDFGIAKASSQNQATQFGLIKGKVGYMSPEQAEGKDLDIRSDIFAIGAVLYEMVTGERLYKGDTMEVLALARKAKFEPPENLVDKLPHVISRVIHRALAKNLEERYQSCGDMLADVEKSIHELSLRPTMWGLARFMKNLYKKSIPVEEQAMMKAASLTIEADNQNYDATIFMSDDSIPKPVIKKRISVFGALAAGKTSIARRFAYGACPEKYNFTLGVTVCKKKINYEDRKVDLDIWDFEGEDKINEISPNLMSNMEGYIIVIDSTRFFTLNRAVSIRKRAEKISAKVPFICVVNKSDLSKESEITKGTLASLEAMGWTVINTSAKTGLGVNKAFMLLIAKMLKNP